MNKDDLDRGSREHYADPAMYDFWYRGRTRDVDWYRWVARECPPGDRGLDILELGAGTGRISIPLAQAGHHVIALDAMHEPLEVLASKARQAGVHVDRIAGDVRTPPVADQSLDLVIAPFNVLMHLYDWRDLAACLKAAAYALRPGGRLALDVFLPDAIWLLRSGRYDECVIRDVQTGVELLYSKTHVYDPMTQILDVDMRYEDTATGAVRVDKLAHRQIYPQELLALVALAGFDVLSHTGDFTDRPPAVPAWDPSGGPNSQCVVAKKRGPW